uniref:DDE Tnp4 domain-containing protein n=1 Tax=Clastoptera arizonana TaxID=38151 RepID=A0A1B6DS20_9HEMI
MASLKTKDDKNLTPMFIDVKREPEDYDEQKFNDEPSDHENDPLSSIKVEKNDHPDSNTASTSAIRNAFEFVKHEVFSEDEDISMDVDYENNDVDIEFDDNSSISISDNLSALKQEPSSDKSTESSEEGDGSDEDDDFSDEEEEDDDEESDEEEDEDEESDESSDDEDPNDPLLKCLKILVDNPDLVLDDPIIALILLIIIRRRKKKKIKFKKQVKRRPWTLSKNCEQIARVNFQNKFDEIRKTPKKFLADYNMSVNTFDELLEKISHKLKRKNTMMRCAISPAERLAVTLRYLVTGNSSSQLLGEFNIGKTTISQIIKTTTDTIWEELKDDSLPNPTKEEWSRIADKFYEKTDFPNCVGSISCKYVKVYAPKHKESEFDRHRKYFATALLAIVDSDMRFLDFSVGVLGNENDNFLTKSTIGKKIIQNIYKLPEAKCLSENGPKVPFIFTNKDSLNINLMKPFPKTVDKSKLNFNSRIGKTLDVAETCLKYIANKWLVLKKGIGHHTSVESTIKAICLLHNFIMKTEGIEVTEENWTLDSVPSCGTRGSAYANEVRNHFVNYFLTPEGAVPWQCFKSDESNVEKTQPEIEKVLIKEENFNAMADAEEHDDISQTIESDDDTDMKETDK